MTYENKTASNFKLSKVGETTTVRNGKKIWPILILLFALCFAATPVASAQFNENPILNIQNEDKALLNWGYYLGFNQYDFQFEYENDVGEDVLVDVGIGFNVGLIGELRLNQFLDLRFEPGLFFAPRDLLFPNILPNANMIVDNLRETRSTYISFPLLLKASTKRFGNFKPFLIGGFSTAINLGSNEDSIDDNLSGGQFRLRTNTYSYELGFGIDFYTQYFKFAPSIRGVFAINDELVRDNAADSPFTGNINALRTRGVFLNFTFE